MSLILITHDLGIVAENTDEMIVMYSGKIVECGPTKTIFEKLAHPYTRGLFKSIPDLAHTNGGQNSASEFYTKKRLSTIPGRVPEFWETSKGCSFADRCSRAQKNCHLNLPEIIQIGKNHSVSCFLPYEEWIWEKKRKIPHYLKFMN